MRRALWAWIAVLALVSVACGGGTDEGKPAGGTGGGAAGSTGGFGGNAGSGDCPIDCIPEPPTQPQRCDPPPATCGNGTVEPMQGEQCEANVPITMTCADLNMGTGVIMCNAPCCALMEMCPPLPPVVGGNSGGMAGTGG